MQTFRVNNVLIIFNLGNCVTVFLVNDSRPGHFGKGTYRSSQS